MAPRQAPPAATTNKIDRRLGQRIRKRREELGISEEALASRVGETTAEIKAYENGTIRVSALTLLRVLPALETSAQELLSQIKLGNRPLERDEETEIILRAFQAIRSKAGRKAALEAMKDLAEKDAGEKGA